MEIGFVTENREITRLFLPHAMDFPYNFIIMELPVRKHMRLPDFDYSNPGAYFVTMCTQNRRNIFGSICENQINLNPIASVVGITWQNLKAFFDIEIDTFVIMPNHFHGIIWINDRSYTMKKTLEHKEKPSLITIIQTFKSLSTKRIHQLQKTTSTTIWQRGFYESVIRDEVHLNTVREYIVTNPQNWQSDKEFLE